eukprot:544414-Pleurochrysis_carterae.AAC.1
MRSSPVLRTPKRRWMLAHGSESILGAVFNRRVHTTSGCLTPSHRDHIRRIVTSTSCSFPGSIHRNRTKPLHNEATAILLNRPACHR